MGGICPGGFCLGGGNVRGEYVRGDNVRFPAAALTYVNIMTRQSRVAPSSPQCTSFTLNNAQVAAAETEAWEPGSSE